MKVLFLGYDRTRTRLIDLLESRGASVEQTEERVSDLSASDLVVSFGYRHILKEAVLQTAKRPVLNLHISYLPWNRGAHPLFWAAHDKTPCGVTIHQMDAGIDTGLIVLQRHVLIDYHTETFSSGYKMLIASIEALFDNNIKGILSGYHEALARHREEPGSFHRAKDLPQGFTWNEVIAPTIERLRSSNDSVDRNLHVGREGISSAIEYLE